MLKWLKRIVLGVVALVLVAVAVGAVVEQLARRKAHETYKPKGQLVDVGGRRMHLDCRGQGAPTVVLEAGLDTYGSLAWSAVHDQLAAHTRTCAYDRSGVMWSDPKSTPQDGEAVAADLHKLLANAGEKGPFVLVGHSLGGPYIMNFTRLYPADVAGLVFVDASHPDQFKRFKAAGLDFPELGAFVQKLMVSTTWMGWMRIPTDAPKPEGVPVWAAAAARAYMPESVGAAFNEGYALDTITAQAGKLRNLGDRPIVVLSGIKPLPKAMLDQIGFTPAQAATQRKIWLQLHDEETSWSTRSRHQIVPDAGHYIQFDRPDVVIKAVTEVVDQVRANQAKAAA